MHKRLIQWKEALKEKGTGSRTYSSVTSVYGRCVRNYLKVKYKMRYGDLAPRPDEKMYISPTNIEYGIAGRHIPDDAPPYGIIGGSWDLEKKHWQDTIWDGLRERFEEGKDWEETVYYEDGMERLSKGNVVQYADLNDSDGARTLDEFEEYLSYLDQLYHDIKWNGYRRDSPININIGRNGEWISNSGHHRRTIAILVDVETVPVIIRYRHEKWQRMRQRIRQSNSVEDLDETEREYLNHPDVDEIADFE